MKQFYAYLVTCLLSAFALNAQLPFDSLKITVQGPLNFGQSAFCDLSAANTYYFYSGIGTSASPWTYVVVSNPSTGSGEMTPTGNPDEWTITIHPVDYYGIPDPNIITDMGFLFFDENQSKEGKDSSCQDIFIQDLNTFNPQTVGSNGNPFPHVQAEWVGDPSCFQPSQVTSEVDTDETALLQWGSVFFAEKYMLRIKTLGASTWTEVTIADSLATQYLYTGVQVDSTYIWQVQAVCNEMDSVYSEYSEVDTFSIYIYQSEFPDDYLKLTVQGPLYFDQGFYVCQMTNALKYYLHSGVGPATQPWANVTGNWGFDDGVGEMTPTGNPDEWVIYLKMDSYYGTLNEQLITSMGIVFRNENGSKEGKDSTCNDIFVYDLKSINPTAVGSGGNPFPQVTLEWVSTAPCIKSQPLPIQVVTPNTVQLKWTGVASGEGYVIRGKQLGSSDWTDYTIYNNSTNTFNLGSLTPGFSYEWQVGTVCSFVDSIFSGFSSLDTFFFPVAPCNPPGGLHVQYITDTTSVLNWGYVSGAEEYQVFIRKQGNVNFVSFSTIYNISQYSLNGLQPATTYEWAVRTVCNQAIGVYSPTTSTQTFTTSSTIPIPSIPYDSLRLTVQGPLDFGQGGKCSMAGANKYYFHSSIGSANDPWVNVVGNWGQDDGIGLMSPTGNEEQWEITLDLMDYYQPSDPNTLQSMGMVFRNEDGSQEGKDSSCLDIFIEDLNSAAPKAVGYYGNSFPHVRVDWISRFNCEQARPVSTTFLPGGTIQLNWTPVANSLGYIIRIKQLNDENWSYAYITNMDVDSLIVSVLQAKYPHYWQIETVCQEEGLVYSGFAPVNAISPTCQKPLNPSTLNVTATSATITWNAFTYAERYQVLATDEDTTVIHSFYVEGGQTSFSASNLQPSTTYHWSVRSICDTAAGKYSYYSYPKSFTTSAAAKHLLEGEANITKLEVGIYPNPARDQVTLLFNRETEDMVIDLYDTKGRKVLTKSNVKNQRSVILELDQLVNGVYHLVINHQAVSIGKRLIITK